MNSHRFQRRWITASAAIAAVLLLPDFAARGADLEQQVAQFEELSAQWDKLNAATSEFAAALESIKDPVSAAANAGTVEAKVKEFTASGGQRRAVAERGAEISTSSKLDGAVSRSLRND